MPGHARHNAADSGLTALSNTTPSHCFQAGKLEIGEPSRNA
jgi:hypothetical protein